MHSIVSEIDLDPETRTRLEALPGVRLTTLPFHESAWDLPEALLPGPEVLLCKRPPRNLDALTRLQWIQITTVGYEHLRDRGFADRAVRVCNARGLFDTAIAEWNLAMMIALTRDVRAMLRQQEHAVWDRQDRFQQEIRGRVVGLWGYGGIGRETARLCKAFGMVVHVLTRSGVVGRMSAWTPEGTGDPEGKCPDRVFGPADRKAFLSGLDYLILALPHTKESEGLIGPEEFACLGKHAFLLNPARGPIVQEAALLDALRRHAIAGAALDTHFAYPLPADHPLWRFPNVILTPHISGADKSRLFQGRIGELFVENVRRWLESRPLLNELTKREWNEA